MKTLLFVILDFYADWESTYLSTAVCQMSKEYIVKTVSLSLDTVNTIGGFKTIPDYSIEDAPQTFAGLFLIGGYTWRQDEAKKVLPLINRAVEQGVPLGAICAASEFIGVHGYLNQVKHTSNGVNSFKEWNDSLYTNDKDYINEQAVSDKNIITANGSAALEFTKECLLALNISTPQGIEEWYQFYKQGYCEFVNQNK